LGGRGGEREKERDGERRRGKGGEVLQANPRTVPCENKGE